MSDTMHHHRGFLKIEEDAIVAAPQSIVAIEVGQPLDIAMQTVFEP
jgi:hypothetical protein